ncbi:DNA fragmentation factor subunit alpha [Trichomycterus rosablanca]|uniref:DNA fragmentation factor subunit alpha n=1 Tax=Trichomycterus rosablanca TaxID=2290929 RepID=UPI002F350222
MSELKPCKVCNFTRHNYYGLVVPSLAQFKAKGSEALGLKAGTSVTLVLDNDGTIVEDVAYFMCLPPNTKFMLLQDKEKWTPAKRYDGGTAWLRQSIDVETDAVDSGAQAWHSLANQLSQDLGSIILMSEAELQSLVDVPCAELASALGFPEQKTQDLQSTVQRVLDQREEERQSKELLQLYLRVVERENSQALQHGGSQDETDSAVGFNSKTLLVLKNKSSPEMRLSNEELQMVLKQGVQTMMGELGWDQERTTVLLQACEGELNKRLQQVQAMRSLSVNSQHSNSTSTAKLQKLETPDKQNKHKK